MSDLGWEAIDEGDWARPTPPQDTVDEIRAHYKSLDQIRVAQLLSRSGQLERYAELLANGQRPNSYLEREFASRFLTDEERTLAFQELVEAIRHRSYYYDDSTYSELTEHDVVQLVDLALIPLLHGPDRMCAECSRRVVPAAVKLAWSGSLCFDHHLSVTSWSTA